jgi:hypothetical protein
MKMSFKFELVYHAPTPERPDNTAKYGFLNVIARSKEEAKTLIEQYLAEQQPTRRGWRLKLFYIFPGCPVSDNAEIGIVGHY